MIAIRQTKAQLMKQGQGVVAMLLVGHALLLFREAWLHEDTFITLRSVINWVEGYGLVWNTVERVQTYTHPLWMLVLSAGYFITRESFFTTLAIGLFVSISTMILLLKASKNVQAAIFVLGVLTLSRSYVDYTTSGLENALSHLLLATFGLLTFRWQKINTIRLFWLTLIATAATLNRMDTLLFYVPPLLILYIGHMRTIRAVGAVMAGGVPLLLWLLFSLFYYGFAFPNTAYTKLNTGIPDSVLWIQGIYYFIDLFIRDPLTFLTILCGLAIPLVTRESKQGTIAVGILLYLVYVMQIGGGYMSGRFFTTPLVGSLLLWTNLDWVGLPRPARWTLYTTMFLLGILAAHPTILPIEYERRFSSTRGITDERQFYDTHTGLLNNLTHDPPLARHWLAVPGIQARESGDQVLEKGGVGLAGYFAGPDVYVLDTLSLGDVFTARLPIANPYFWRPGHFKRIRPEGYDETIHSETNQIVDEDLAAYYEILMHIVRGPLWDRQRIMLIWEINTGQYDHYLDKEGYAVKHIRRHTIEELTRYVAAETPLHDAQVKHIPVQGLEIVLQEPSGASAFDVTLDGNYNYRFVYYRDRVEIAHQVIRMGDGGATLHQKQMDIPGQVRDLGFDMIRIYPSLFGLDQKLERGIGHLILLDD